MTIANASTILASDVNAMLTTNLGLIQDDNEQVPGVYELHIQFAGVVTGTAARYRKFTFVAPCDCYLETFSIQAADHTASSTIKGAVTAGGGAALAPTLVDDLDDNATIDNDVRRLVFWPTKVSATSGSGIGKIARLLFDGTKTKPGRAFATTNRAHRTFLKGSTITVSVSSSGVATANTIAACLVLREFWSRE